MNIQVEDQQQKSRFVAEVPGGTAIAEYRLDGGVMVFTHTEVPAEARDQGFGGQLVRAALEEARARNLKVIAECPFVRKFIDEHPEFQDLQAEV